MMAFDRCTCLPARFISAVCGRRNHSCTVRGDADGAASRGAAVVKFSQPSLTEACFHARGSRRGRQRGRSRARAFGKGTIIMRFTHRARDCARLLDALDATATETFGGVGVERVLLEQQTANLVGRASENSLAFLRALEGQLPAPGGAAGGKETSNGDIESGTAPRHGRPKLARAKTARVARMVRCPARRSPRRSPPHRLAGLPLRLGRALHRLCRQRAARLVAGHAHRHSSCRERTNDPCVSRRRGHKAAWCCTRGCADVAKQTTARVQRAGGTKGRVGQEALSACAQEER